MYVMCAVLVLPQINDCKQAYLGMLAPVWVMHAVRPFEDTHHVEGNKTRDKDLPARDIDADG